MPAEDFWTPVYNAFNPWERLWGEKLDTFFVEREHSPLRKLAAQFRPGRAVQKTLLIGHRGSGKSSELLKLVSNIGDDFFTVWFDANLNLDIFSANQVELLFLLGVAVYRVAEREGLAPDRDNFDLLVDCLQTLVREHTQRIDFTLDATRLLTNVVCFGLPVIAGAVAGPAISVGVAAMTALARELAQDAFSLGLGRQEVARLEVEPRTRDVARAVNLIIADVEQKADKLVLMVVDGLDKLEPGPAHDIFINSQVLSLPTCRVIYVTPITLYYSPDFSQTRQQFAMAPFPNVKLSHRFDPDTVYPAGLETMREVVRRRLRALGYEPEKVIGEDALDLMARMSGGVMREMVSLMREAVVQAEITGKTRVTEPAARAAVYELRRQYAAGLRREHYRELEAFLESNVPSQSETCGDLLRNLYILSYVNDEHWYDVHPNVRPLLEGIRSG
ncbi:MAG: hypothetical protein IMY86_08685 [Chloroflexi bacterium]|nr:hypothetical protein [Chloroflexota bacterium]